MNALRNLPVILSTNEDGTISAQCTFLPECRCRAASRSQALETMQKLIERALASGAPVGSARKYEVVHVAVASAEDSTRALAFAARRSNAPSSKPPAPNEGDNLPM